MHTRARTDRPVSSFARVIVHLVLACTCALMSACVSLLEVGPAYQANEKLLSLAPLVVFQGARGPLSYQTATGRDALRQLPVRRVRGRACQRGFQLPIFAVLSGALDYEYSAGPSGLSAGWGDGSYEAAINEVRRQLPAGAVLFDVRADLQQRAILSVYRELCVVVDAGVMVAQPPT